MGLYFSVEDKNQFQKFIAEANERAKARFTGEKHAEMFLLFESTDEPEIEFSDGTISLILNTPFGWFRITAELTTDVQIEILSNLAKIVNKVKALLEAAK